MSFRLAIERGTTGRIITFKVLDARYADGIGLPSLTSGSSGLAAYYLREGDTSFTTITLSGSAGSGYFQEISFSGGYYQLTLPDAATSDSTDATYLIVRLYGADNMYPVDLEYQLTEYELGASTGGGGGSGAIVLHDGTAAAGAAGTITFDSGASAVDDYYNYAIVAITSGTGAGQSRFITDYAGSTKVASVVPNWVTNPDSSSVFSVLPFGEVPRTTVAGTAVALSNNAITSAVIQSGAITAGAFAAGAIDATAIADNAIDAGAIATGAITAAKFAAGAIDAAAIADNAIDAGAIATDAITSAKIADGAITNAKVADDVKVDVNSIDGSTTAADNLALALTGVLATISANVVAISDADNTPTGLSPSVLAAVNLAGAFDDAEVIAVNVTHTDGVAITDGRVPADIEAVNGTTFAGDYVPADLIAVIGDQTTVLNISSAFLSTDTIDVRTVDLNSAGRAAIVTALVGEAATGAPLWDLSSVMGQIVHKSSVTAGYDRTTDALEAIRDATGGGGGGNITAINNNSTAAVNLALAFATTSEPLVTLGSDGQQDVADALVNKTVGAPTAWTDGSIVDRLTNKNSSKDYDETTDSLEANRDFLSSMAGSGFSSESDSLQALRDRFDAAVAPQVVTSSAVTGDGWLADCVNLIRKYTDEPAANVKYTDADIIELINQTTALIWGDLNANSDHPAVVRMALTIVADTQQYVLPPQCGQILTIAKVDTSTGLKEWEVLPGSEVDFSGYGFRLEGNTLRLLSKWRTGYEVVVTFVPVAEVYPHKGTKASATITVGQTTFTFASSPDYGTIDGRPESYAGYLLRVWGTESGVDYTEERVINSYDRATLTATLNVPFSVALSSQSIEYEVIPAYGILLKKLICLQAARMILAVEGDKRRYELMEMEYQRTIRGVRQQISTKEGRYGGTFEGNTPDNLRRAHRFGGAWL